MPYGEAKGNFKPRKFCFLEDVVKSTRVFLLCCTITRVQIFECQDLYVELLGP